jgi:hypothetical protein
MISPSAAGAAPGISSTRSRLSLTRTTCARSRIAPESIGTIAASDRTVVESDEADDYPELAWVGRRSARRNGADHGVDGLPALRDGHATRRRPARGPPHRGSRCARRTTSLTPRAWLRKAWCGRETPSRFWTRRHSDTRRMPPTTLPAVGPVCCYNTGRPARVSGVYPIPLIRGRQHYFGC